MKYIGSVKKGLIIGITVNLIKNQKKSCDEKNVCDHCRPSYPITKICIIFFTLCPKKETAASTLLNVSIILCCIQKIYIKFKFTLHLCSDCKNITQVEYKINGKFLQIWFVGCKYIIFF